MRSEMSVECWKLDQGGVRWIRITSPFSPATRKAFARLVKEFSEGDAERIKKIEAETNHDVKAIEYWLKAKLAKNAEVQRSLEFIHFACTSEDINNLSYALMLADSRAQVMLPRLDELVGALKQLARRHAALPMLSRTHGQPASSTTLGKELANRITPELTGEPDPSAHDSSTNAAIEWYRSRRAGGGLRPFA